jgi:hypothetical protein
MKLGGTIYPGSASGVTIEHCDMPGMTRQGDVYRGGGMKVAWFKDPDGNILNIVGQSPRRKWQKGVIALTGNYEATHFG